MPASLRRVVLSVVVIVHLCLCLAGAHAERGGPPGVGFPGVAGSAADGGHHILAPSDDAVSGRSSDPADFCSHHSPVPGAPEKHHHAGCHNLAKIDAPVHAGLSPPVPWLGVFALPAMRGERPAAARAHPPGRLPPAASIDLLCLVCVSRT
ncbi:MAG: hypothetical protein JWL58_7126 [Streptosporangiaceae bacterium]|nr:hypothetical protein [Streptosporangiaceae bacterium]